MEVFEINVSLKIYFLKVLIKVEHLWSSNMLASKIFQLPQAEVRPLVKGSVRISMVAAQSKVTLKYIYIQVGRELVEIL